MITLPSNRQEYDTMVGFLTSYAFVQATPDMRVLGWVSDNQLKMVVGLNAFIGSVCQIHVAMAPGFKFTPQEMLEYVFHQVFNVLEIKQLLGVVNSFNKHAMKYDLHLGFTEIARLPGMHDEGGDLVLFGMKADQCRHLDMTKELAA